MTVRVLTGSKQDIAREVAGIDGDVREAIVFVEERAAAGAADVAPPAAGYGAAALAAADPFAEMEAHTVAADDFDDTRPAIYARGDGE